MSLAPLWGIDPTILGIQLVMLGVIVTLSILVFEVRSISKFIEKETGKKIPPFIEEVKKESA